MGSQCVVHCRASSIDSSAQIAALFCYLRGWIQLRSVEEKEATGRRLVFLLRKASPMMRLKKKSINWSEGPRGSQHQRARFATSHKSRAMKAATTAEMCNLFCVPGQEVPRPPLWTLYYHARACDHREERKELFFSVC